MKSAVVTAALRVATRDLTLLQVVIEMMHGMLEQAKKETNDEHTVLWCVGHQRQCQRQGPSWADTGGLATYSESA